MRAYTIQMARWKRAAMFGITVLDITVKSGDKVFAPTWDMVNGVKSGILSVEAYTELYTRMMRHSYRHNKKRWLEVLSMDKVAFACFCAEGDFCHRHLLIDFFGKCAKKHGIDFVNCGETGQRK